MPQYLLSVHSVDGEAREPMTDEQMQQFWQEVHPLEAPAYTLRYVAERARGPGAQLVPRVETRRRASSQPS